jgi:hypothetical protein
MVIFGTLVSIKLWKAAILYAIVQLIAIGLVVAAIVSVFAAWAICSSRLAF